MTKIMEKASVVVLDVKKPRLLVQILGYIVKLVQQDVEFVMFGYFQFCIGLGKFSTIPRVKFQQGHPVKNLWSF
jgi:hypothetical protein